LEALVGLEVVRAGGLLGRDDAVVVQGGLGLGLGVGQDVGVHEHRVFGGQDVQPVRALGAPADGSVLDHAVARQVTGPGGG
jgi:hypothetical protein